MVRETFDLSSSPDVEDVWLAAEIRRGSAPSRNIGNLPNDPEAIHRRSVVSQTARTCWTVFAEERSTSRSVHSRDPYPVVDPRPASAYPNTASKPADEFLAIIAFRASRPVVSLFVFIGWDSRHYDRYPRALRALGGDILPHSVIYDSMCQSKKSIRESLRLSYRCEAGVWIDEDLYVEILRRSGKNRAM